MKNFVKYLLTIAICAAALLSSCIKEQPYELNIAQLEVAVTRADASDSVKQGDGISNAKFWVFECGELDSNGKPASVSDSAISWRFEDNLKLIGKVEHVHMELPLCDEDYQNYILVAVLNTDAFGSTIDLNKDTTFTELQEALFDASNADFWKRYPYDGDTDTDPDPWKMPISNWKTFTVTNDNTHPSNCYKLILPVYRAVAKSQLFVKPTSNNFTVTVTDARICSSAMPQNGAILTSNVKSGLKNNTINVADVVYVVYSQQGNAGDDVEVPAVVPDITYQSGADAKPLYNTYGENSALEFSPITASITASVTDYTWAGSTFIYENEAALQNNTTEYKTVPTGNNGYYMQISYQVSGDTQTYTRYVALPAVVRNHDYQVKATVDAGGKMTLTIHVNEWTEDEDQVIDYQNSVTVETGDMLKWTSYTSYSNTTNVVPVVDGNINFEGLNNGAAQCTFRLRTPIGGRWYAELVTISGDPDHFIFEKAEVTHTVDGASQTTTINGSNSTVISGDISDGLITLYIKTAKGNSATQNNATEDAVVELQISAKKTWGGRERTYKVYGLTGLDNNANYTLTHLLGN